MSISTSVINKSNIPTINQAAENSSQTAPKIFTFQDQYIPSLDKLDESSFFDEVESKIYTLLLDMINKFDNKLYNDLRKVINLYEERYRDFKCVDDEDKSVWLDEQSWMQDQSWYPQYKNWYSDNKSLMIGCLDDDCLHLFENVSLLKRPVKDSDIEAVKEVVSAHGLSEEFQAFLNLKTPATIEDLMEGACFALYLREAGIEDAMSFFCSYDTSYMKGTFSAEDAPKQSIDLVA